jgi:hypothetical protein
MSESQHNNYPRFKARYGDPTPQLHEAYDSWLADMSSREDAQFVPIAFNPILNPEQGIYEPKMEAHDPHPKVLDFLYYGGVELKLVRSLGATTFLRLSQQFNQQIASAEDPRLLTERLIANQREGRNTMAVTSHFSFTELGYFKALRFVGKKDRPNITSSGVLLNKLMTRQSYNGRNIVDLFTPLANVYFSYPKSASAEKHGVPIEATNLGNALFKKVLKPDLEKGGMEMDIALTGKQIVPIKTENDEVNHYEIPPVDSASAKLVEYFDDIVAATIINSPITGRYEMEIGDVLDIHELLKTNSSAGIVDSVYDGIAHSVEEFTGKEVDYRRMTSKLAKQAIEQGFK